MPNWDVSELLALTADIRNTIDRFPHKTRAAAHEVGKTLKAQWQANARASAGSHGVHYPRSITYETRPNQAGAVAIVGPESGRPQGGMGPGFEFGSVNQPPHLDGQKALDKSLPAAVAAMTAISELL